jgi:catechol 2,3-dioxygenase-like lactoylglutathione lyase family enzyme
MVRELESLFSRFESGSLNRREFMQGLLVTTSASVAGSQPVANSLNHVSLAVSDVDASQAFYERVLEVSEVSRQFNGVNLGLGDSFLGLYDIRPAGQIHHFCVGVEDFDIQRQARELTALGVEPRIRQDRPELYFADPDGITVQLSAREYGG